MSLQPSASGQHRSLWPTAALHDASLHWSARFHLRSAASTLPIRVRCSMHASLPSTLQAPPSRLTCIAQRAAQSDGLAGGLVAAQPVRLARPQLHCPASPRGHDAGMLQRAAGVGVGWGMAGWGQHGVVIGAQQGSP